MYRYFPKHIIIIITIIKTSTIGPSGKNKKLFIISYATPQAPAPCKTEKQIQGSNQRLTAPLNPSNIPVSNSVGEVIPHTSLYMGALAHWNNKNEIRLEY